MAVSVARELAEALRFADTVSNVLPVDDEADQRAARALREHRERHPATSRKLARRPR